MAMFLGEIAFLFELTLFVAGLALWHYGRQGAAALRAGAMIAMVGAVLTAACTGYYMVRYHVQGDFESAYLFRPGMMHERMMEPGGMMKGGEMGHGMMPGRMERRREGMGEGATDPGEMPQGSQHEEHPPEQATQ